MLQTKTDWRAWVAREPSTAAGHPTLGQYEKLTSREKLLINRSRQARNSEFVTVETSTMLGIVKALRSTLRVNEYEQPTARRGIVIDGIPGLGKSTLVQGFGKAFELELRYLHPERFVRPVADEPPEDVTPPRYEYCPVVYITTPKQATPKMLAIAIAEYLEVLYGPRESTLEITNKILKYLAGCKTQLLIVDDIHFLDLSEKEGKAANDFLKQLANMCAATFLYAGVKVRESSLFSEGAGTVRDTQTSARFTTYRMEPFGIATKEARTEWATVIKVMEENFVLYRHVAGSLARHEWRYLHNRTGGKFSALTYLLKMGVDEAIENGDELITRDLLETIRIPEAAQEPYDRSLKQDSANSRKSARALAAG